MATPCSVKAIGRYFECSPLFMVRIRLLKEFYSSLVSSNMKSGGNLRIFLLTARFTNQSIIVWTLQPESTAVRAELVEA